MNKVLIVEDEDIIRKGLMFMAKWSQYDCVVVGEAINGNDGLKQIEEKRPDIVIVDINMPEKDGLSMIEESIELYGYDTIIISGYSEFSYAKKAISLGVSDYLLKPINFNELYPILEKIIARRNHLQQLSQDKKQIDIEYWLNFYDLYKYKDKKYRKLSLGTKQKLYLIQAFMSNPNNLILDECFNGLDEKMAIKTREFLKSYIRNDRIIILTSHIKSDIEELCDEVIKLN